VLSSNGYLQEWLRGLTDNDDDNNKCLTSKEKSSLVAAVESQSPAAVSVEELGLPIPVIHGDVISPAAELYAQFSDGGMSEVEPCSDVETDTGAKSIPVLMHGHCVSSLQHCNYTRATQQPM